MGKRKIWYTISVLILVVGLIGLFTKGIPFGIDFVGGTELLVRFNSAPSIGDVRQTMETIGFRGSEIKTFGNEKDILINTIEQGEGSVVAEKIRSGLTTAFPNNPFQVLKEEKIGPKIGAELRRNAVYAVFATLFIIMVYVGFRFKFIYGVAGIIAIAHDVLAALGVCALVNGISPHLNLEVSQNLMAAFLTLIGFSINDTVIVFDRIRENLKIHKTENLFTIMNKSINETLSRTIITTGTVVLVLIVLFIFGGEVNRGFAFAFLIGTIFGTYSSIYVASAIVLDWTMKKDAKKTAVK